MCNIRSYKTGPPNPFQVTKDISTPRKGGLDLKIIPPKAIIQQKKEQKNMISSGAGSGSQFLQENLIGKGESSKSSKLAFLHPIKVRLLRVLSLY